MTNCKTKLDLYGKDFLKLLDFSAAEITGLVDYEKDRYGAPLLRGQEHCADL